MDALTKELVRRGFKIHEVPGIPKGNSLISNKEINEGRMILRQLIAHKETNQKCISLAIVTYLPNATKETIDFKLEEAGKRLAKSYSEL